MTDTVLTALIAAGAALLGTFLGPFTDFLNNKRAMKQRLWAERHACYSELLQRYICLNSEITDFRASPNQHHYEKIKEAHTQFQVAYCRAILICKKSNIDKLSNYFEEVKKLVTFESPSEDFLPIYRAATDAMREELL